jgi:hypothetical protein
MGMESMPLWTRVSGLGVGRRRRRNPGDSRHHHREKGNDQPKRALPAGQLILELTVRIIAIGHRIAMTEAVRSRAGHFPLFLAC